MGDRVALPMVLKPEGMLGKMAEEAGEAPIPGAVWYVGKQVHDGLSYRLPMGVLAGARCLTADLLVDGNRSVAFSLQLQEGEGGPRFSLHFSALNQSQARMRCRWRRWTRTDGAMIARGHGSSRAAAATGLT